MLALVDQDHIMQQGWMVLDVPFTYLKWRPQCDPCHTGGAIDLPLQTAILHVCPLET